MPTNFSKPKRVAIAIEMEWGFKHHLETYAGCQKYADEVGWVSTITPRDERILKVTSDAPPFDGIIARATEALTNSAKKLNIPIVNVWLNSPVTNIPTVNSDFRATGVMAANHLLGRGFQRFGFMGFQRDIDSRLQAEGFRDTVRNAGFPCTNYRFSRTGMEGKAQGWEIFNRELEEWIDTWEPPIGIAVCRDLYCRYLIDACRRKSLNVSQDVAIVGRGNEPIICNSPSPTLTSIDMGHEQIGYRAARILEQMMNGEQVSMDTILLPPSELIPRQSSDAYAAEDPLVAKAMRYIAENCDNTIKVDDVCKAIATSRRTLERKFRESVDRSIAQEITRLRIESAKRRLVYSDAALKSIAMDSGFRNSDQFYKVFQRVEGMPPSKFREGYQKV